MNCQVPVYFQIDDFLFLHNERNAGDFATFYRCWRSARHNAKALETPAECGRLGNYACLVLSNRKRGDCIVSFCTAWVFFHRSECSIVSCN